jgi:glycosyltransferase involved in cell wall biosynthesis
MNGVSIIIPCHNSSERLPETLRHLVAQTVSRSIPWEVIVVDNNSSDNTAGVAQDSWPSYQSAPLRVVAEPQLGDMTARIRGFREARYEFISCLDDDNWVCPEWVEVVAEVMSRTPTIGACGGHSTAVCECNPPDWFEAEKSAYAIGAWGVEPGDVTEKGATLWSAGLTIRKTAWEQLERNGFKFLLAGRRGNNFGAGCDSELCLALRLAGWRWWYEPRLRFQHYLPARRLAWKNLCRLHRGFGASGAGLLPYHIVRNANTNAPRGRLVTAVWLRKALWASRVLFRRPDRFLRLFFALDEGNHAELEYAQSLGYLTELMRQRGKVDQWIEELRASRWIQRQN